MQSTHHLSGSSMDIFKNSNIFFEKEGCKDHSCLKHSPKSPLYKRLRILGEQEEIVLFMSPNDELADAAAFFA